MEQIKEESGLFKELQSEGPQVQVPLIRYYKLILLIL